MRIPHEKIQEASSYLAERGIVFTGMPDVIEKMIRLSYRRDHAAILGESGTGKEMVVRGVELLKKRTGKIAGDLYSYNCASIPEHLAEPTFFGYKGGAFTGSNPKGDTGIFHRVNGHRLFLDEIGELPRPLQAKLLRVLETGQFNKVGSTDVESVDFQIFVATSIQSAMDRIREDFFHRVSANIIELPRFDDRPFEAKKPVIQELMRRSLGQSLAITEGSTKEEVGDITIDVDDDVIPMLCEYRYPGNVRELNNVVGSIVAEAAMPYYDQWQLPDVLKVSAQDTQDVLSEWSKRSTRKGKNGNQISTDTVANTDNRLDALRNVLQMQPGSFTLSKAIDKLERVLIPAAIEHFDGNRSAAAGALGITRQKVYVKLRGYAEEEQE